MPGSRARSTDATADRSVQLAPDRGALGGGSGDEGDGHAAGPVRLGEQRLCDGDAPLGEAGLGVAEVDAPEALEALVVAELGEAIGVGVMLCRQRCSVVT